MNEIIRNTTPVQYELLSKDCENNGLNLNASNTILEKVNEVVYLGSMFSRGIYEMDAKRRIAAGNWVNGALAALMKRRSVSTAACLAVSNAVLVTWVF